MSDTKKAKIYFSYAWRDEKTEAGKNREDLVQKLYTSLEKDGFDVRRDKENCKYGESISDFIKEIGKSDLIIVFVSEKYAKSPYCMQELFLIAQNNKFDKSSFQNTILPIVVEFIKFDEPKVLREYFEHWKNKEHEWQQFINDFPNHTRAQSERLHIAKDIQNQFGLLSDWIADINAFNNTLLEENDFEIVKKEIIKRIGKPVGKPKEGGHQEQENEYPKTRQEFEKFLEDASFSEIAAVVREYIFPRITSSERTAFNEIVNQEIDGMYSTRKNKDRVSTLLGKYLA
jgi:hypothetical protein